MTTVYDLLQLEEFRCFQVLSGSAYLTNPVSTVDILEYESEQGSYADFSAGDFVLTSLFFAKDHPERILTAFTNLIARGISAVAVKAVYYKKLPAEVLELSERKKVPLLIFQDTYMEDIIISANNCIRRQQKMDQAEQKVRGLTGVLSRREVQRIARTICPDFPQRIACAYFRWKSRETGGLELAREFSRMLYRRSRGGLEERCLLVKYEAGFFLFCLYQPEQTAPPRAALADLLPKLGLDTRHFCTGICSRIYAPEQLDAAVQESLTACAAAEEQGSNLAEFDQVGMYRLLLPLCSSVCAFGVIQRMRACVRDYDCEYHTRLYQTAQCWVACGGNVQQTAEQLYQHPNTIRYRLQKIRMLLEEPEEYEFQVLLYLMVRAPEDKNE